MTHRACTLIIVTVSLLSPLFGAAQQPSVTMAHITDRATAPALSPRQIEAAIEKEHGPLEAPNRPATPYRTTLVRDALFLGAGLGGAALGNSLGGRTELTEQHADRLTREAVNWFDRSATSRYSRDLVGTSENVASVLAYAPLALLLDPAVRGDWATVGLMYVQTTLLSSAAANITKGSVHRYRPYVYNASLTYDEKTAKDPGGAFFSSAATYAFARAVFLSTVYGDFNPDSRLKPFIWAGSLGTAAVVGYLRYESGLHYPSDVVVGALVGSAIGYAVPRLHRVSTRELSVTPLAAEDGLGLNLRVAF